MYAHDKTYLSQSSLWHDEERVAGMKERLQTLVDAWNLSPYETRELVASSLLGTRRWKDDEWAKESYAPRAGRTTERRGAQVFSDVTQRNGEFHVGTTGHVRDDGYDDEGDYGYSDNDEEWVSDDDANERIGNFGFSRAEVDELLSQGVQPWDDDAWDVLDALRNM